MRIGYIGLGIMGRPCVLNLLKAGLPVSVWARRRESAASLLEAGAAGRTARRNWPVRWTCW